MGGKSVRSFGRGSGCSHVVLLPAPMDLEKAFYAEDRDQHPGVTENARVHKDHRRSGRIVLAYGSDIYRGEGGCSNSLLRDFRKYLRLLVISFMF